MKHSPKAGKLRGSEVMTGTLDRPARASQAATMNTAPSPSLMGLSDVLDGAADWLTGQNGNLSSLLESCSNQKGEVTRELKLAVCLKELAAFQRAVLEELQEDDDMQPKDLNQALFSGGSNKATYEEHPEVFRHESDGPRSKGLARKGCEVGIAKNSRRRELKDVRQKPWSLSTKSPVRPLQADGGFGKGDRMTRLTRKSPSVAAKSRQAGQHSSPLAFGRRLSTTPEKRRQSLGKPALKCKRTSMSLAEKPKPAERKKSDVGIQASKVTVGKKPWERTSPSRGGQAEGKAPKLTDRQKEILKRVVGSPLVGMKKVNRKKANCLYSSIDLSVAGRRARRLSQVLRNENDILLQNQQYVKDLKHLRDQFASTEEEAERAKSAGMLLKQLCAHQAEELKAYKGAFPALFKELSDLREDYQKQENELLLAHSTKLSLQSEVSKLQERVDSLSNDIKQTRTLNTVLAERVQQNEKTQCCSCRLHSNQKPLKREVSPSSPGKKSGLPLRTPPRPRFESKLGRKSSPRQSVTSMREVENICQQANKQPVRNETGDIILNRKREPEQQDSALQAQSEIALKELSSTDNGPPVDALKSRISNLLLTASHALDNHHRTM